MARTRADKEYVIEAAQKCFVVLEALAQDQFKPVRVPTIQERTGFTYDFCRRALRTLKAAGWAVETERGWQLSVKAGQFSEKWLAWASQFNSEISELKPHTLTESKTLNTDTSILKSELRD